MTEAAIESMLTGIYVSLGEPVDGGAWSVRVYHKPFVTWIWAGCLMMALGGLLAISDRRTASRNGERPALPAPPRRNPRMRTMSKKLADPARRIHRALRVPAGRLVARSARSALAADRQAGAGFTLAQLHEPSKTLGPADLKGQVWLLNVWASWCVSCREEHPLLVGLARAKLVPIVGLDYKDETVAGKRWLAQHGDPYTVSVVDLDGRVGIDWGVYGVPETFVVDKAGTIRYKQIGPVTAEALEQKILPLIRELQKS